MQIPDFTQAKVLVVGDLMLDKYWLGPTGRISPEAPVPVVKIEDVEYRPGGAANVALNLATLGAKTTLLGICGDDENAKLLRQQLSGVGVECDFVELQGYDTITKLRVLSRNQQLIRLDFEKKLATTDLTGLINRFKAHLSEIDLVLLSDYDKGALGCCAELIEAARALNIPVIVDPKGTSFDKYRGATLLTPNMGEFVQIKGEPASESELVSCAQTLIDELQLDALLVTRSEKGMTLIANGEQELHLPARAKEVYDVTGAGDTVISVLSASLAAGADMQQACALANTAASIVVGKLGTATVSENELAAATDEGNQLGAGVMTEQQLIIAIEQAKKAGKRVVMTNGCFDILHAGHVAYLQEASALGDKLIVAVNADDSVTRLKGEGRPINKLDRRMAVLAGLGAVDWVVSFSEDTPQRLIANLLPDVLVKGGDYTVEQIAGGREVIENGGEVQVLTFEDGVSTTQIIRSIVDKHE